MSKTAFDKRYLRQASLVVSALPEIYSFDEFALHGGTAINLFYADLARLSVDIDLTYIPIASREESLSKINHSLAALGRMLEKHLPGVRIEHRPLLCKLECWNSDSYIKIEVNKTKRGVIADVEDRSICSHGRSLFGKWVPAHTVPYTQLYGDKLVAALSRQHPRDLFDFMQMGDVPFDCVRDGFILGLLGSERPIVEILSPNLLDRKSALKSHFQGMSSTLFTYEDYENQRSSLLTYVNSGLSSKDFEFLISFESGEPDWSRCSSGDLSRFPAVQWKLQNIALLRTQNETKHRAIVEKLQTHFEELKASGLQVGSRSFVDDERSKAEFDGVRREDVRFRGRGR